MRYEDIIEKLNAGAVVYDEYDYEFEEYDIDYVEEGISYEEALKKIGGDKNDID